MAQHSLAGFMSILDDPRFAERADDPHACDFIFGNPHDLPLQGFVKALEKWVTPKNKDWFAYKLNEPEACETVAESLRMQRGLNYRPEDIFMTNGAFAALAVTINAISEAGDEIIFISPPWFFYEPMIIAAGAVPVRVRIDPQTFDLDLAAIERAITARTRGIIINSPNNPTGKIYSPETLHGLADILMRAKKLTGRPIYLLSDEAYSHIVYDSREFYSAAAFYPHTFLIYTYGKTLLTPGQRIGYIALPPNMPDAETVRESIFLSQMLTGYAFPNALLQHAISDLEQLSIDIPHLQEKRDWMVGGLRQAGYDVHAPEGTFYLMPRSPLNNDLEFTALLVKQHVYCLPGKAFEMPGYFRISLTANDAMIRRALPAFAAVMEEAQAMKRQSPSTAPMAGAG
jgi:aspartate aminotransferase